MDNKIIQAACLGAATTIIAVSKAIIEEYKNKPYISRQPRIHAQKEREFFIESLLNRGDRHCVEQIRMKQVVFSKLCDILTSNGLLHPTPNMPIREQVLIFLRIVGHNERFRVVSGYFYRSVETIHRYFMTVLRAVLRLYKQVIREPDESTPPEILNNERFYPYFKDCIGALDGTHILAKVPLEIQGKFCCRKGVTTQNVLAAITFDLKFTYVLAGWEGTAHDARVLNDALSRRNGLRMPEGKYYLADAGYGIRNGIISPYRGVRYHLKEFTDHPPENEKELFNLRHSSLRTTIERGFGILKKRFRAIDNRPFWSFKTQVDVVLASCIFHNIIMGVDPIDFLMEEASYEVQSTSQRLSSTHREERDENREWITKRDTIASSMWNDYNAIN